MPELPAPLAHLVQRGIKPSDILSREAFENAIAITIALEGSTNAVPSSSDRPRWAFP